MSALAQLPLAPLCLGATTAFPMEDFPLPIRNDTRQNRWTLMECPPASPTFGRDLFGPNATEYLDDFDPRPCQHDVSEEHWRMKYNRRVGAIQRAFCDAGHPAWCYIFQVHWDLPLDNYLDMRRFNNLRRGREVARTARDDGYCAIKAAYTRGRTPPCCVGKATMAAENVEALYSDFDGYHKAALVRMHPRNPCGTWLLAEFYRADAMDFRDQETRAVLEVRESRDDTFRHRIIRGTDDDYRNELYCVPAYSESLTPIPSSTALHPPFANKRPRSLYPDLPEVHTFDDSLLREAVFAGDCSPPEGHFGLWCPALSGRTPILPGTVRRQRRSTATPAPPASSPEEGKSEHTQ